MERVGGEGSDGGEFLVYICWGGYVEVRSDGGLTYHGGRSDCAWLRKGMGIGNMVRVVEEVMGEGLSDRSMWFNTKYDRSMMVWMQRDVDVGKLIKGNEEFAYIYVAG